MEEYDYYTITLDYLATGEGLTRGLMIQFAKNEDEARKHFADVYGSYFAMGADVKKGIHINEGYDDLLTDMSKKFILKIKTKSEDRPPMFSYQNMIHFNYS